jgi:Dna[CI] antecedent DciA-like protein
MTGNQRRPPTLGGASFRGPKSLADLLSSSPMLSSRTAQISLGDWQRSVGERLALKTFPERIVEGVLTVRVPSSTWAQELSLLSQVVLERLQAAGHRVQRLRFHVSPSPPQPVLPFTTVRRVELPERLQRSISRLGDPDLREVIAEAAAYSLARKPLP